MALMTNILKPAEFTAVRMAQLVCEGLNLDFTSLAPHLRMAAIEACEHAIQRLQAEGVIGGAAPQLGGTKFDCCHGSQADGHALGCNTIKFDEEETALGGIG